MSDNGHQSRLHIHIGGLIILIIITLILFKVDIKEKIQSPQFQKNITYVEEQIKNGWDRYLKKPLINRWSGLFNNIINKGVGQIKKNINLKIPSLVDPNIELEAPLTNTN